MRRLDPHQIHGVKFLLRTLARHRAAGLLDEPRVGKTPQTIRLLDHRGDRAVLILAPVQALVNWRREIQAWSILPRRIYVANRRDVTLPRWADVVIADYGTAVALREAFRSRVWDVLVLDEVHYLKSVSAARTRAVLGPQCEGGGIADMADRVIVLSGTPMPNHPGELWPWMRALMPEVIDNLPYWPFVRRYAEVVDAEERVSIRGGRNLDELRGMMAARFLQRTLRSVRPGMPDIRIESCPLRITDAAVLASIAQHPETDLLRAAADAGREGLMPDGFDGRAVQGIRSLLSEVKAVYLADLLTYELTEHLIDKVVIFGWHRRGLETLHTRLAAFGAQLLYGGTAPADRQTAIDRFQRDPSCRVFVGHLMSAGTAITLDAAAEIVSLEEDWVPATNSQAYRRCSSLSQDRPVRVRHVYLQGTVDERVHRALQPKDRLQRAMKGEL